MEASRPEEKCEYPFGKDLKRRSTRRAKFRDYKAPGFYMITITANQGIPPFCKICNSPEYPRVEDTPLGEIIRGKVTSMPEYTPQLEVRCYVLMPDHIHMLVRVKRYLDRHLGRIIGGMMGGCTSLARKNGFIGPEVSLFKDKFHDRIVSKTGQIDVLKKYIADNPRRLLIKRMHPDLFKRYLHLRIGDREFAAYGNIFLLKSPDLLPVKISRRWSDTEFDRYENYCIEEIGNGAIPISPFIHKREKDIRDKTIESGGKIIILKDTGFEDRFKPQGNEFELCAEGRLLLLAPWPDNTGRKSNAGYVEFHLLNDMAAAIAKIGVDIRTSVVF